MKPLSVQSPHSKHFQTMSNVVTRITNDDCLTLIQNPKRLLLMLTLNISVQDWENKARLHPVDINTGAYWHFKYPKIQEPSTQKCRICIWQRTFAFLRRQLEDRWIPWGIWNGIRCPCLGNLSYLLWGIFWLFMYERTK